MGDVAANLLHHLNNQVGTIPARVEGIQDKCGELIAQSPYLAANLAEIERAALDAMQTVRERLSPAAAHHARARQRGRVPGGRAAAPPGCPPGVAVAPGSQLAALPPVLAGREGLTLVLLNLLDNAGEALGRPGRRSSSRERPDGIVEVVVADNGPGIAPEMQARIFDFDFSGRRRQARAIAWASGCGG